MTFIVSLIVALMCIPLSVWQSGQLAISLGFEQPRKSRGRRDSGKFDADPRVPKTFFTQSLELAYNFPAIVLTVIAYGDEFAWRGSTGTIVVLATVILLGASVWLMHPRNIRFYATLRLGKVSALTWLVIAANFAGIILALAIPNKSLGA